MTGSTKGDPPSEQAFITKRDLDASLKGAMTDLLDQVGKMMNAQRTGGVGSSNPI